MKRAFVTMLFFIMFFFIPNNYAQNKINKKTVMKRYLVERSFSKGIVIPMKEKVCSIVNNVVTENTKSKVTWIKSYISTDKKSHSAYMKLPQQTQ